MNDLTVPLLGGRYAGQSSIPTDESRPILGRWMSRRAYRSLALVLRMTIVSQIQAVPDFQAGLSISAIVALVVLDFLPEIVISNSKSPALFNTIAPWRQNWDTLIHGSTSRHFAYHRQPKTPALTFPSWGRYEPVSSLGPDDPAWPYPTREIPAFPHTDGPQPVGVFVALLCMAQEVSRRETIRRTYDVSRWGDEADGLAGVAVKFFVGQPKSIAHAAELDAEMKAYGDIVVLPITENLNRGKTFAFFEWAAIHARVPDCTYHQRRSKWVADCTGETVPDYVVKADMDTFLVLPAVERRLRLLPRSKVYWGREFESPPKTDLEGRVYGHDGLMVRGDFMAGAGYGVSFDMVRYFAESPFARTHRRGNEDQRVADWVRAHPQADRVVWVSEECWMYDHPKASQPWTHGFLYPATVQAMQRGETADLSPAWLPSDKIGGWSTTSPSNKRFTSISPALMPEHAAEALVEGSPLSLLHPHNSQHALDQDDLGRRIVEAYEARQVPQERSTGWEAGSTLWVHAVKQDEWWHDAERAFQS